jgi:phosphoglycerate-specific signal transduction histidine kinase
VRHDEGLVEQFAVQTKPLDEAARRLRSEIAALERGEIRVQSPRREDSRKGTVGSIERLIAALAHELNQYLAAASFLVAAARLRLAPGGGEAIAAAREDLDEATTQILQVAQIIRELRDQFAGGERRGISTRKRPAGIRRPRQPIKSEPREHAKDQKAKAVAISS